jgi:MFS family permease
MQDRLVLALEDAPAAVSTGVLIHTIVLVLSGWIAGRLSDRTGRRRIFVAGSTALPAVGTAVLVHVESVTGFSLIDALLGLAYGIYVGVDLALVVDVLPNPDDSGKDLGVFNMANNQNYELPLYSAGAAALVGVLVVLPIKKVR